MTLTIYNLLIQLLSFLNQYSKQIMFAIVFTLLVLAIVAPNAVVFANGASGNASG